MATTSLIWHLTRLDLFTGADEEDLCNALGYDTVVRKHARRKSVQLEEGTGVVYGLTEGMAKAGHLSRGGGRVIDSLIRPGDLFGRLADEGPKRTLLIETITPCTVVTLEAPKLRAYLSQHPDLMLTVLQIFEDRERRLTRRLEALVFKDVYVRVIETVLQLAIDVPQACPYGMAVDVRVTQSDIAELVGASRQAVNKVLRSLETQHLVHRHDRVLCVPDLKRLADHAEAHSASQRSAEDMGRD